MNTAQLVKWIKTNCNVGSVTVDAGKLRDYIDVQTQSGLMVLTWVYRSAEEHVARQYGISVPRKEPILFDESCDFVFPAGEEDLLKAKLRELLK
jgi:hypothetical protein